MAFGVKVKNIKTKSEYTIEELYDAIKDHPFSAGQPSLTKHGLAMSITFPALDRQNQVWIMRAGFKEKCQKFSIQKSEAAGLGNVAVNAVLDDVTDGLFSFGRMAGKNAKECERLVDATYQELTAMGL